MSNVPFVVSASAVVAKLFLYRGSSSEWANTKYGKFKLIDKYTTIQFLPWWERKLKEEVGKCRGLFVDVGANAGIFTVIAAMNGCEVISVEPSPKAFDCLKATINMNHLNSLVVPYPIAAWSRSESLKLSQATDSGYNSVGQDGIKIEGFPLDEFLDGLTPSLIKIDTERTEYHVLEGLTETLTRCRPKVIFEAWERGDYERCLKVLSSCGYKVTGKLARIIWVAEKETQYASGKH